MKPLHDATSALLRAIHERFEDFSVTIEEIRSRSWASATFTGARHELTLRVAGAHAHAAADAFVGNLGAAEFSLRGHLLADIALVSEERHEGEESVRLSLEALTVEES